CREKARDQLGFCSNENEYMCDWMSQAQPGYVLSRHVPPTSSAFSMTTKPSRPSLRSLIAIPRPENPVPTMMTPASMRLPMRASQPQLLSSTCYRESTLLEVGYFR